MILSKSPSSSALWEAPIGSCVLKSKSRGGQNVRPPSNFVKINPKNLVNMPKKFSQDFTGGPVVKNAIFLIN